MLRFTAPGRARYIAAASTALADAAEAGTTHTATATCSVVITATGALARTPLTATATCSVVVTATATVEHALMSLSPTFWHLASQLVFEETSDPAEDTDPIREWKNRVDSSYIFYQTTVGQRPLWSATGGPNSFPCVQFDGSDDSMWNTANPIQGAAAGQKPATIFVVIKPRSGGADAGTLFTNRFDSDGSGMGTSQDTGGWSMDVDWTTGNNTLSFTTAQSGGGDGTGTSSYTDEINTNWQVYEIVVDDGVTWYIDGVQITQVGAGITGSITDSIGTRSLHLGGGSGGAANSFYGDVAEIVGWYDTALTTPQRLVARTYFNSKYGITFAVDNTLSATASVSVTTTVTATGTVVSGFTQAYSMLLDGSNDYLLSTLEPWAANLPTSGFTISMWINPDSFVTDNTGPNWLFGRYQPASHDGFDIHFESDQSRLGFKIGATTHWIAHGMSAGTWYHVCVTFDGGTFASGDDGVYNLVDYAYPYGRLYIDGTEVKNGTVSQWRSDDTHGSGTEVAAVGVGYRIAGSIELYYFSGKMDEVAVWDTTLDADAVTAIYNSGAPSNLNINAGNYDNSGDLIAWWRMEENTGLTVADSSTAGAGGNLTLTNGAAWDADNP